MQIKTLHTITTPLMLEDMHPREIGAHKTQIQIVIDRDRDPYIYGKVA